MENSTSQTPLADDGGSLRSRFNEATDEFVQVFTASIDFDQRLYREDIAGSIAHATMWATTQQKVAGSLIHFGRTL